MARFTDIIPILDQDPERRVPAAEIARHLGVSTRTVRNYVTATNRHYGRRVVTSSRAGYRLDTEALERAVVMRNASPHPAEGPNERLIHMLRELIATGTPLDVFDLAESFHVSESTVESDLTRARVLVTQFGLSIVRSGHRVHLEGDEVAQRRLMRRLLIEAAVSRRQFIDVEELARQLGEPALLDFKRRMLAVLTSADLIVNDRTADELVAHIAIMVGRVRTGHAISWLSGAQDHDVLKPISQALGGLVDEVFHIELSDQELAYLALLLLDKAVPARPEDPARPELEVFLDAQYVELVTDIVHKLNENYLIDLSDERFTAFLALHIRHLVDRASHHEVAQVPAGQSVKNTHPLVHELAVFIAQQIERGTGIKVAEDEIGFIAFHVGGRLQSMHEHDDQVDVTVVVPRYYDTHLPFSEAVGRAVAGTGRVERVVTNLEEVTPELDTDLIVTTVPLHDVPDVPVIRTGLLLSQEDLGRIGTMAQRIAAGQKRFKAAAWLTTVMDPHLFIRIPGGGSREAVLSTMTEALAGQGAVGPDFLAQVMERERLSTTALPSGAAIPHTIEMTAIRSAIAVCLAHEPVDWAGTPVRLVAMLCLSEASRDAFGDVFDAFIRTLVNDEKTARLAAATSYDDFIQTMLAIL